MYTQGEASPQTTGEQPRFKILLGYDASEHSMAAIRLLCDLPPGSEGLIKLVEVVPPRQVSSHFSQQVSLEAACGFLDGKGYTVVIERLEGSPADLLLNEAKKFRPHLLVLGSGGLKSALRRVLGSVAQRVAEEATCPVLVVRSPYQGLQRVLLALDKSPNSQLALECLVGRETVQPALCPRFPLPKGVEVDVIHILPPLLENEAILHSWAITPEVMPLMVPETHQGDEERVRQEAAGQALLKAAKERLLAAGLPAQGHLFSGDASSRILKFAREQGTDLIVLGSRGLGVFQSWLLGSVSRTVLTGAECCVLVVKGEFHGSRE